MTKEQKQLLSELTSIQKRLRKEGMEFVIAVNKTLGGRKPRLTVGANVSDDRSYLVMLHAMMALWHKDKI